MGIQYDAAALNAFFGEQPAIDAETDRNRNVVRFDYTGNRLKYTLYLHFDGPAAMISGDPDTPFGGNSIFEIAVPCDSISVGQDPYHEGKAFLMFWYGPQDNRANLTMSLMKRPDGDLKVWLLRRYPVGHAWRQE